MHLPGSSSAEPIGPTEFSTLEEHARELSKSLKLEIKTPRCAVLYLGSTVGNLCSKILLHAPPDCDFNTIDKTSVDFGTSSPSSDFWGQPSMARDEIYQAIGEVFSSLMILSNIRLSNGKDHCSTSICKTLNLRTAILKKMALNAKKYPVSLSKGKSGKYTEYSHHTGISKAFATQTTLNCSLNVTDKENRLHNDDGENDSGYDSPNGSIPIDINTEEECETSPQLSEYTCQSSVPSSGTKTSPETIPDIAMKIRRFAYERDWPKFHTPRNLVLAIMGEVGELAELFQFMGDESCFFGQLSNPGDVCHQEDGMLLKDWKEEDIDHVQQEVADVCIYLLRLADVIGIQDLGRLVLTQENEPVVVQK